MPEVTEKEVELKELDKDGKPTGKTIKVKVKKDEDGNATLTVDGDDTTLEELKKNKKPGPGENDRPARVTGYYDAPYPADNRNITIIVDCAKTPPIVEIVVTFADGDDQGKRDEPNCQKFEISPEECTRLKAFIWQLEIPELVALGPGVPQDFAGDKWIGSALAAFGASMEQVGQALTESRPEWIVGPGGLAAYPGAFAGIAIRFSRTKDTLELVVTADKEHVRVPGNQAPPKETGDREKREGKE
jgi:hypothetical protein